MLKNTANIKPKLKSKEEKLNFYQLIGFQFFTRKHLIKTVTISIFVPKYKKDYFLIYTENNGSNLKQKQSITSIMLVNILCF